MKSRKLYIAFTQPAFAADGTLLSWASEILSQYQRLSLMSTTVSLTKSPETADYILFVDCHVVGNKGYAERIRSSDLFKAFREKVFVYDQTDNPRRGLPGLYVSMPRQLFKLAYMRSVPYLHYEIEKHDYCSRTSSVKNRYATFVGDSTTSRVRRRLFEVKTECVYKFDTSNIGFHDYTSTRPSDHVLRSAVETYCDILAGTTFSLSPRGFGASSFRLYESMLLDSIPVVISDDFVAPIAFKKIHDIVRLRERDIHLVGDHLSQLNMRRADLTALCHEFVQSVLSMDRRLDFVLSELDCITIRDCEFCESTKDKVMHKIYWLVHKHRESRKVN